MSKLAIQTVSRVTLGALLALAAFAFVLGMIATQPDNAYAASETSLVTSAAKAASKTVTLPVITRVKIDTPYGTVTEALSYKTNGLVKSIKTDDDNTYYDNHQVYTYKFTYTKKNKLKSMQYIQNDSGATTNYSFTRDKKGRVVKCASDNVWNDVDTFEHTYKYNKKSQLKTYTYHQLQGNSETNTKKYTYDKNGNVKTLGTNGSDNTYSSDRRGSITKMMNSSGTTLISCKNTYKSNKLVKRVAKRFYGDDAKTYTYKISYKKMKVPATLARMVKAQQYAIVFDQRPASIFDGINDYPLLVAAN